MRQRKQPGLVFDLDAANALIDRHLSEYEWILERATFDAKVARMREETDGLRALNPDGIDAVELARRFHELQDRINQVRLALADRGGRTDPSLFDE